MKFALVYDSACGPCTRFKEAIRFLDARKRLRYIGIEQADEEGLLDGVPGDLRHRSFHLVSPVGDVKSGAAAFPDLARLLPAGHLPALVMERCTPVTLAAAGVYLVFSRLHFAGSCSRPRQEAASTSTSTSMGAQGSRRGGQAPWPPTLHRRSRDDVAPIWTVAPRPERRASEGRQG